MSTHLTPPRLRIKNRWFHKAGGEGGDAPRKDAAEQASAMAFIIWRLAVQVVKRLRAAKFEVDAGLPYLGVVCEALVFLATVADRIAYQRMAPDERAQFVVALVRHLARHLGENADDLLGPAAPGTPPRDDAFIDLFNQLAGHYAEFGADPRAADPQAGFEPDFAFVRYFGVRLEPLLPEADRRWVLDQVMVIEAPEAVTIVQRSMHELLDPSPPAARRGRRNTVLSGD